MLPGAEDEVGKVVEVEASGASSSLSLSLFAALVALDASKARRSSTDPTLAPRAATRSTPSSSSPPVLPDTWTLLERRLTPQRSLLSTTWSVVLSSTVLHHHSASSSASARRCEVTFRLDDPHEVRARAGQGRAIASGGGRERLPVWAEMARAEGRS